MSRNSDLNLLLDRIRLYDLEIYLEKLRWSVAHSKNGKWKKYRLDDGAQLELIIPENENLVDAKMRISQIIEALSQIYDVNQRKICADIIGTSSDSLLIHLNIERHKSTIPLESVPKHVTALKNLILYSACSEIEALPFFERPPSKADGMLGGFEFCHTFAGSFGFEVSATIVKPQETQDFFGSPSRRIVERIARGVKLLDMAVANDDPNILADNFKVAMNARMCDALADIGLEGKTNFDIEVEWASMLEPAPELKEMGLILINEPKINMLKFVSEKLKAISPHFENISGVVINLHCSNNPNEGTSKRTVLLKVDHAIYKQIDVKIDLGPDFYLKAIEAHKNAIPINVKGQLQRVGGTWSMEAITQLEVI